MPVVAAFRTTFVSTCPPREDWVPNSAYSTWATSLAIGVRRYNNAVNVDGNGDAVEAITDMIFNARCPGKAAGVYDSLIRCWTVC